MKNTLQIIFISLSIIYGVYFCFIKINPEINFNEQSYNVIGYIDDYGEQRIGSNRYRVRLEYLNNYKVDDGSRILITNNGYIEYEYGQRLEIIGSIEKPKDFITDSGKTFDYDNYLKIHKIYGIMQNPDITILDKNAGNFLNKKLFKIRKVFANKIDKVFNYESAALIRGVLLGEKTSITNEFRENLSRSGTSHIIALSGYNMTIVSEAIMKIFTNLSLLIKSSLGILGIIIFLVLTGASSSAFRASIMAIILIYVRARGKKHSNLNALLIAIAILIFVSPLSMRYDMGFHLSVLATFGLITYQSSIAEFFIRRKLGKFISETLSSTVSATIMTMPYIAYNMGTVSLLGVFANIIILPFIPLLMLAGFVSGVLPIFIAKYLEFIGSTISSFIIFIINKIGELNWSAIYVDNISIFVIIIIYLALFYKGFKLLRKDS